MLDDRFMPLTCGGYVDRRRDGWAAIQWVNHRCCVLGVFPCLGVARSTVMAHAKDD